MNDRDYWYVEHFKADRHFAVISPLGVIFRRYPDCYQAHVKAAEMNGHMLGVYQYESDLMRPVAHRSQDDATREAFNKLMEDLEKIDREEDGQDDPLT